MIDSPKYTETMKDKIQNGKFVAFSYKVKDTANGELLFEAKTSAPDVMVYGVSEDVIPGLIAAVKGLSAGDRFAVTLPPEVAFGPRDEQYVMQIPLDAFMQDGQMPPAVKEGARLDMMTNQNTIVSGIVRKITPEYVEMDFNHPFAGKTVEYEGEIIEVRDATEEELHPKHACGCGCGCSHHESGDGCGCGDDCNCGDSCGCGDDCKNQ